MQPRLTFFWQFSAPSLEGHVTSVALVNLTPSPILLQLPIREPIEPWGYDYAYQGTLEQRAGETTPALGGIFEVLAAGDGVLNYDIFPRAPIEKNPVGKKKNWHESGCRS